MKRPWWFTLLVAAIVAVTAFAPLLAYNGQADDDAVSGFFKPSMLAKLFPAYALASASCAWLCWPSRKELAWILLALLALSCAGLCIIL